MNIIKLPPVLPDNLDLATVNQQLREHTAQLDWSAVVSAPEQHVAVLLAGLDASDDADVLSVEDGAIADHIAGEIFRFLQKEKRKTKKPRSKQKQAPKATPDSWKQGSLLETQFIAAESQGTEAQGSLLEMRFIPSENRGTESQEPQSVAPNVESDPPVGTPARPSVLEPPTPYQIRAELEQAVLDDLLGPAGGAEEEVDEDSVSDRYLVGLLAAQYRRVRSQEQPEQQDELAIADKGNAEEGSTEASVPPTETMFPSSFGMTFCVCGTVEALEVTATWGQYRRVDSEVLTKEDGSKKRIWKRQPMQGGSTIALVDGDKFNWTVLPDDCPNVYIQGQSRRQKNGDWMVTLFLVNGQTEPAQSRDEAWLFQPQVWVRSAQNQAPNIFLRKPLPYSAQNIDPVIHAEAQAMARLYRKKVEFAVGHGVGVHAETAPGTTERAVCLSTSVAPVYEVPKTSPPKSDEIPELAELVLDMKELAQSKTEELSAKLNALTTAYEIWIERERDRIQDPAEGLAEYHSAAKTVISNCQRTLERIRSGLALLQSDQTAAESFRFMNQSMWQQRIHSICAESKRRGEEADLAEIDVSPNRTW